MRKPLVKISNFSDKLLTGFDPRNLSVILKDLQCPLNRTNEKFSWRRRSKSSNINEIGPRNKPPKRSSSFHAFVTKIKKNSSSITHKDIDMLEEVGCGAFGKIIRVRHRPSKRFYVIKEALDTSRESQESALNETVTLRLLCHQNVVHCVGMFVKNGLLCPILEYVEGGPLDKIIVNIDEPLPWTLRCRYARDIAAGMEYLHQHSIIHRDLNSPNCLVRKSNTVVIADFGLSVYLTKHNNNFPLVRKIRYRLPVVGSAFGMAPEMLAGKEYNERVDLYSFGVILCELMTRLSFSPDNLPRNPLTLAMDMPQIKQLINEACPKRFYCLAELCCSVHPEIRPSFEKSYLQLNQIVFHQEIALFIRKRQNQQI